MLLWLAWNMCLCPSRGVHIPRKRGDWELWLEHSLSGFVCTLKRAILKSVRSCCDGSDDLGMALDLGFQGGWLFALLQAYMGGSVLGTVLHGGR